MSSWTIDERFRKMQWRIQGRSPPPHLFLDQTEARRAEKIFFDTGHPLLCKGLNDRPPPPTPTLSQGLDLALKCLSLYAD